MGGNNLFEFVGLDQNSAVRTFFDSLPSILEMIQTTLEPTDRHRTSCIPTPDRSQDSSPIIFRLSEVLARERLYPTLMLALIESLLHPRLPTNEGQEAYASHEEAFQANISSSYRS